MSEESESCGGSTANQAIDENIERLRGKRESERKNRKDKVDKGPEARW